MDTLFGDIEQLTNTLRSIINDTPKLFEQNKQSIDLLEKEIMDIEHVIELTTFNASKGYILARDIQTARVKRRELKDQNEMLQPLVEVVTRMRTFQNDLNKAVGEIRKIKSRHLNRQYKMRVREDLQEEVKITN
ncbi:hypothetical protein PU629_07135 [Pullulanibacillus sp. KACC 23026]|uniref:hypothetical protein n=1 Tax=Pullulanibacillus sp. KACC 23026 TaxID=3028315 RepID=UPI0023B1A6FB|nr:hypothetical protein [Pullulanibacillus sp. KACC 23026]WEG14132.1 hypothetical protein PU629_07135 [Pullulanibacillus sp. KACC 23026]